MIVNLKHEGKAIHGPGGLWSLTFQELSEMITAAENKIQELKAPGTILTLTMGQNSHALVHFLAALKVGTPIAIFSSNWTELEIKNRKNVLGRSVSLDPGSFSKESGRAVSFLHSQAAVILFTSGSTGKPKAVQLSLANIKANKDAVIASLQFKKAKKQHLFLDLSYSFGLFGQFMPALESGTETFLHQSTSDLRTELEQGQLEGMLSGVPGQLKLVLMLAGSKKNEEVTHVVSAGAFLPVGLRKELQLIFPNAQISSNYGQTEASPRILSISHDHPQFLTSTTGKPVLGLEARVSDQGKLEVRGPQIMLGYLDDKTSTEEKIKDGWLCTGDLASIDSEGLVSIQGRKDDQFKVAGERISPFEVENTIRSILGLHECLVFAQNTSETDSVVCLVLPESEKLPDPPQIRKLLIQGLSGQRVPKLIYLAKSLPKNSNGKLIRVNLDNESKTWKKI